MLLSLLCHDMQKNIDVCLFICVFVICVFVVFVVVFVVCGGLTVTSQSAGGRKRKRFGLPDAFLGTLSSCKKVVEILQSRVLERY